ncbi:MAG: TolC family protein [Waddliaceae bacterium]
MRIIYIITCLPLLFSCQLHRSGCLQAPRVIIPEEYSSQSPEGVDVPDAWWTEFGSQQLNVIVDQTLMGNLNLKESWAKIAQACARLKIEGAARLPAIDLGMNAAHFSGQAGRFGPGGGLDGIGESGLPGSNATNFYTLEATLSYEIDLWRRVASKTEAACYELQATREDLDATALTLTGSVVDLWFTIQEQQALLEVIREQEEVSRTLLELVELRFSTALSTALDVFQQRLQLADILAQPPPIHSKLETSIHNLQTLMGAAPGTICLDLDLEIFNGLPPFPKRGAPIDLICRRPDLRAQYFRLQSADAEIAAAIADIFPRLDTFFTYGF